MTKDNTSADEQLYQTVTDVIFGYGQVSKPMVDDIMSAVGSYTKQRELALLERLESQYGETIDTTMGKPIRVKFVTLSAIQKEKEKL